MRLLLPYHIGLLGWPCRSYVSPALRPARQRISAIQRIHFYDAALLPPAPEPAPTKRQRRRARGKAKARR